MRPVFVKGLIMGLVTACAGIFLMLTSLGQRAEEDLGLGLLFSLRGARQAPHEIAIIGIDRPSIKKLGLPENLELWSRGLYARLVDKLREGGAALIVFDIFFGEPRDPIGDHLLTSAVQKASNVVLVAEVVKDKTVIRKGDREAVTEKVLPPYSPLAESAAACAPFILPKVPVKVSQAWLFRSEANQRPTLPAAAFAVRNAEAYGELVALLGKVNRSTTGEIRLQDDRPGGDRTVRGMSEVRGQMLSDRILPERIVALASERGSIQDHQDRGNAIKTLISLFVSPDSRYLDFYGPPGTIQTHSLMEVLGDRGNAMLSGSSPDVKGRTVFIGVSDLHTPGQKDGFYTVFSQDDGFDLSGVEIAATAYANIHEDRWVRPLSPQGEILLLLSMGMVMGGICRLTPILISLVFSLVVGSLYLYFAYSSFSASGAWYPLVAPLCVQMPCALFGSALWRLVVTGRERKQLREAIGRYLPEDVVDGLLAGSDGALLDKKILYSTCLYTDAGHYTALSESSEPKALADLMNEYFEVIFRPVRHHGGTVSNVVADSVLCLWVSPHPDVTMNNRACLAALEIEAAVARFNVAHEKTPLPTRVTIHAGEIFLGSIGAPGHYEYRPLGDMVNTATRLDAVNRALGVRVSLSEAVKAGLEGIITRELGRFKVPGKSRPVVLHEAIGRSEDVSGSQRDALHIFGTGLDAFRHKDWSGAEERFRRVLALVKDDGPSRFYLELCSRFSTHPPDGHWQGEITMSEK